MDGTSTNLTDEEVKRTSEFIKKNSPDGSFGVDLCGCQLALHVKAKLAIAIASLKLPI